MQDLQDDEHNPLQEDGRKQFYISESSSSSSNEGSNSGSEDADSDTRNRFSSGEKSTSWQSGKGLEESDDSPLHSLEDGFQHGPTMQRIISQYLDHNLDDWLLARKAKKGKDRKTIKAAALQLSQASTTVAAAAAVSNVGGEESAAGLSSNKSYQVTANTTEENLSSISSESPPTLSSPSVPLSPMLSPSVEGLPPSGFSRDEEGLSMDKKVLRKKKRTHDVTRHLDRDSKRTGNTPTSPSHSLAPLDQMPPEFTREKKLSCVRSHGCHTSSSETAHQRFTIPGHSSSPDCPPDRLHFYKNFSTKVRSTSRMEQRGEKAYTRMVSNEDQIHQRELCELIFIEIRAWQSGLHIFEEDRILFQKRQAIPSLIEEVMTFNVQERLVKQKVEMQSRKTSRMLSIPSFPPRKISCDNEMKTIQSIVESIERGNVDLSHDNLSQSLRQEDSEDTCGCSESLSRLCQDCVTKETEVLNCIVIFLSKLEESEHLYPSTRSLGAEHVLYNSPEFVTRVKSLNLWLNITYIIRQKINLLAKLFGLKDRALIGWPCYDVCCNDEVGELSQPSPSGSQLKALPRKLQLLHCRSVILDGSPSTSNSDASDRCRGSGPVSPEIVLGCPFDTPSSTVSSGYQSAPQHSISHEGNSDAVHIYAKYVDKTLKHKGLKNIYSQLSSIFRPVLNRAHQALKQPKSGTFASAVSKPTVTSGDSSLKGESTCCSLNSNSSVSENEEVFGVWSNSFQEMGLPTFHRPFLFLLRVPLDVIHVCIKLRLQQQPDEPSELSIGQIVKECKEVLKAGVQIRQRYVNLAQTVLSDSGSEIVEGQLEGFDEDLKSTLQAYLRYLEQRMLLMQKVAHFTTLRQKSCLEEEWTYVRQHCPHIPGGEALAANKFCFMASDLLGSIGHSLESAIDECFTFFYESTASESEGFSAYKKCVLCSCRKFKHVFKETSERSRQAIAFAKTLRKDLEIATEFKVLVSPTALMVKLSETGHIRVIAPHSSSHVMFVPGHLLHNEPYIWQLVDMTCGHESPESQSLEEVGYLILMRVQGRDPWAGPTLILEPTAEATITLSHVEVDGVLLVVNHSSQLMSQCRKFQRVMSSTLQVDKQQTSCNHAIAEALNDLKSEALDLREKMCQVLTQVEEKLTFDPVSSQAEEWASLQARGREVLHQGYNLGFEYQKAVARLITGEARRKHGLGVISFARQWIKFVSEKCERGRGLRPRWANQGLDFLVTACEPHYTQLLTDDEFKEWKQSLNDCLVHLTGERAVVQESRPLTSPTHVVPLSRLSFSGPLRTASQNKCESTPTTPPPLTHVSTGSSSLHGDGDFFFRRWSKDDLVGAVSTNWSEGDLYTMEKQLFDSTEAVPPIECVRKAVELLEIKKQRALVDRGVIGHISDLVVQQAPRHISARRVTFSWQRGFKIGEGRFGKVYTAVNNETGELIAMKEIRLQPNDHRAIKEALDEIRIFEGIKHPNLVRYYGVEVHRDEMLIFMEYCNEGSLESMAQVLLPESLIRKYTRQLLEAVNVLHDHAIVHRDIKSANIFLAAGGALKLGDFGCCIKLKNYSTMPGELHGFVGTPAYMAPEVFTRSSSVGHGRAADIWSLGCVVYEMGVGKRPWHELDSSYQIMFKVGMGETPEIPDTLSQEGQEFLNYCLQSDPDDRWTASQLLDHPFIKVNEDEDT